MDDRQWMDSASPLGQFAARALAALRRNALPLLLGAAALCTCIAVQAQTILWEKTNHSQRLGTALPGGGAAVRGLPATADASGNLFVTGFTTVDGKDDFKTVKIDGATGALLWERSYNGLANGADRAFAIASGGGNVAVVGISDNGSAADGSGGTGFEMKTLVYWPDGRVKWEQTVANALDAPLASYAVVVDTSGNVIVTGAIRNAAGNADFRTVKYAGVDGAVLWDKTFDGSANAADYPRAVALDPSGNVIVAGSATGATLGDITVVKYAAASGTLVWQYASHLPSTDDVRAMAVDSSGNVFVTGSVQTGAEPNTDFITMKLASATGVPMWTTVLNSGIVDGGVAIALDAAGNAVVTGSSSGASTGDNFHTIKYATSNGTASWISTFDGGGADAASAVGITPAGDVIVTGRVTTNGKFDYKTFKYRAADGLVIWQKTLASSGNGSDEAYTVVLDTSGNAMVVGATGSATAGFSQITVVKYAVADGAVMWQQSPPNSKTVAALPGNGDPLASQRALAVDPSGNLLVTGHSFNAAGKQIARTVKYATDSGTVAWEQLFDAGGATGDIGYAVAVDAAGNAVTAGTSNGTYRTAKHAAADGALLWSRSYDSGLGGTDIATGVAIDAAGDVIVVGNANSGNVVTVVKYAAGNGATLWTKLLGGQINSDAGIPYVALDALGNVFVARTAVGNFFHLELTKLAAADGAQLWQRTLDNGPGSSVRARGLAADGEGGAVVIGRTTPEGFFSRIARFAADGTLRWDRVLDGGDALALDRAGNAFVTGQLVNLGNYTKTYKVAAADGAILWQKTQGGSFTENAYAIAVDALGHAFVAGSAGDATTTRDFSVQKFNAADGAVVWRQIYTNVPVTHGLPLPSDDAAYAVAASGNGVYATGFAREYGDPVGMHVLKILNSVPDNAPDPFSFTSQAGVALATQFTSNTVTPAGYATATTVTVAGGAYSIGCGAVFVTTPGTLSPGQSVCVRHTSSAQHGGTSVTTLTVGGVAGSFTTVTQAAPTFTVTVAKTGSGTVAGSGINCGGVCSASFVNGATVTLTATPATGQLFAGWSGVFCNNGVTTAPTCAFVVTATATATANFVSASVRNDFNLDGKSDILWYNAVTGMLYELQMNGLAPGTAAVIDQETDLNWKVAAVADLNGDGRADIVWQHATTGEVYAVLMNGTAVLAEGAIYVEPNTNWKIVGAGDFNGDGKADLLWKNSATGDVFMLLMNGLAVVSGGVIYSEPNQNWVIQKVADFNGDGKADIVWRNIATGDVFMMLMNGTTVAGGGVIYSEPNTNWQIQAAADFDGDGKADILWRNVATGDVFMMLLNGTTLLGGAVFYAEPNLAWTIVGSGDYNGDGRADILWRNTASGHVYMMLMNGVAIGAGDFVYLEPDQNWKILGP